MMQLMEFFEKGQAMGKESAHQEVPIKCQKIEILSKVLSEYNPDNSSCNTIPEIAEKKLIELIEDL